MSRGILVYDHFNQEWRVWIRQKPYWVVQGDTFDLRIQNRYYRVLMEKDLDWFIRLDRDLVFVLHTHEVYKIKVNIEDCLPVDTPY